MNIPISPKAQTAGQDFWKNGDNTHRLNLKNLPYGYTNSEGNFFWDTLYTTPAVLLSSELMSPIFMDFLPPSHVCPQCALHL